jgi:hypothetical protein
MRILISAIAIGVLLSLWMADSGYKLFSFSRNLGTEGYSFATTSSSTFRSPGLIAALKEEREEKQQVTETPTSVGVTHVKTPEQVKAVYMSSWVAGTPSIRERLIKMIDTSELNAVIIDVKDNTGVITWDERVRDLPELIDELHKKNIYVIARISAFQDPAYVKAHPEQAVRSKSTGGVWKDHKGIPWVDTGSTDMWKYVEKISKESYARGFDEINLDYIRFPTDGALSDMVFPISGERAKTDKPGIVGDFYRYITESLRADGIPVSGDLFGIIMVTDVDIKTLGQDLAVALETFDYVAPMVYPSHFYKGTAGYDNPAANPGPIIAYSMGKGIEIADRVASSTGQSASAVRAKLRPWYQDFDMGADYTAQMVRAQIEAGYKLGINSWMLWDPSNKYTPSALKSE